MKVMVFLLLLSLVTQAQTPEEWTQQRKLKIQRLIEQIAANKVKIEMRSRVMLLYRVGCRR